MFVKRAVQFMEGQKFTFKMSGEIQQLVQPQFEAKVSKYHPKWWLIDKNV